MTDNRLRLLASWLEDSDSNVDSYYDGSLESAIKYAKAEVKQEIGSLLQEIIYMSDEDVIRQVIPLRKEKTEYPFKEFKKQVKNYLMDNYMVTINDISDENQIYQEYNDGGDAKEFVDWLASKYNLNKIK